MKPNKSTPIIGGDTAVTLTSAATLTALGVTVSPIGSARLDASGSAPIAEFPITGGTAGLTGDVVLHQGSGLELSDSAGSISLTDFRIDTLNNVIDANASVNGVSAGNLAVFTLGADDSLTLTAAAASAADSALGTTAITPSVTIGTAAVSPVLDPLHRSVLRFLHYLDHAPTNHPEPIVGGRTAVTLTSAATLTSLGVTVTPTGSARLDTNGSTPVANFPVTGGTETSSAAVILHQGSGLELSDSMGSIELGDFLIDTANAVIDANVTVNGQSAGNLAVFSLGANNILTLTAAAASAADAALGTTAITPSVVIGTAAPSPIVLPDASRLICHHYT